MPFAGKYFLAGPLSKLNEYRGVPDATIVLKRFPDISVILADGGDAHIDLETLNISESRTQAYSKVEIDKYLNSIPFKGYKYEREIQLLNNRDLPLVPIIKSVYEKCLKSSCVAYDMWLCFKPQRLQKYIALNISKSSRDNVKLLDCVSDLYPRCEIFINDSYLFGLLTRMYHWNNAAIGSQYRVKRVPDEYDRNVFNFLNKFHI